VTAPPRCIYGKPCPPQNAPAAAAFSDEPVGNTASKSVQVDRAHQPSPTSLARRAFWDKTLAGIFPSTASWPTQPRGSETRRWRPSDRARCLGTDELVADPGLTGPNAALLPADLLQKKKKASRREPLPKTNTNRVERALPRPPATPAPCDAPVTPIEHALGQGPGTILPKPAKVCLGLAA